MDQLEERILQIDQLKNASKCLQYRIDCIYSDLVLKISLSLFLDAQQPMK